MIQIQDELLDIVNNNDIVVGAELRSVIYQQKMKHFRVINALIVNDDGKLWIPKRTATKALFPSCLDMSVGGHVQSGETYDQAFERELQEELRLSCLDIDYEIKAYLSPLKHNVSAFMMVYEIKSNIAPHYNPEDFCDYSWVTPSELLQQIESGKPAKSDLAKIIKILYS